MVTTNPSISKHHHLRCKGTFASNSAKLTGSLLVANCAHRSQDENSHSCDPSMKANLFLSHSEFLKANFLISSQFTPSAPADHAAIIHTHLTNIYSQILLLLIFTKSIEKKEAGK